MNVIREERRQRTEDTADGKCGEQAYLAAFTQPSMRASVIGYMKDLYTLKADDLRTWYKQYYAPTMLYWSLSAMSMPNKRFRRPPNSLAIFPPKAQPPRNKPIPNPICASLLRSKPPLRYTPAADAINFRVPKLQNSMTRCLSPPTSSDILAGNASSRFDKTCVASKPH